MSQETINTQEQKKDSGESDVITPANFLSKWTKHDIETKSLTEILAGPLVPFEELTEQQKLNRQNSIQYFKENIELKYPSYSNKEKDDMLRFMLFQEEVVIPKFLKKAKDPINRHLFQ